MPDSTVSQTDNQCHHCGKTFRRESTLVAHLCEAKRRWQSRDERGVQIAYQAFLAFYHSMHGSARLKTPDDFDASPYYRGFVRFGHYCVNTRVIDPEAYMRWLLSRNTAIDRWAQDQQYTEFLIQWLPQESVSQAISRGLAWAQDWADHNQAPAQHCLRYGNTNMICYAVTAGRMSPWLIYNCDSGQEFLANLGNHELSMIWPYIDSDRWQQRFREYPADQALCQQRLAQEGW
jgi:hypothetical protein